MFHQEGEHGARRMPGWGGYQPRKKSREQLAVERRRALVAKFGAGHVAAPPRSVMKSRRLM
jgi:hypothetical protein